MPEAQADSREGRAAVRDEKIRALWAKGLNRSQIAERVGLGPDRVGSILRQLGLTRNKDPRR